MAGVVTLVFTPKCKFDGAFYANTCTQIRHIWGFGGEIRFNDEGQIIDHCPGDALRDIRAEDEEFRNTITTFVDAGQFDLILVNGKISYPLISKFIQSYSIAELLEEDLEIMDEHNIVYRDKVEEFVKFMDAYEAILDGRYDPELPYHDYIAKMDNLRNLLRTDIQRCYQEHKSREIKLDDSTDLPLNENYSWHFELSEDYAYAPDIDQPILPS